MRRVIILAIGNELLIGETLDTNTHWLCRHFTGLGAQVQRAVMLPDQIEAIASEIALACHNGVDLLITTGGLGPTDDDLTLAALAQALNCPLILDETAYCWIVDKYAALAAQGYVSSADITPPRAKMAILPRGAVPIANPVGAAPAIQLIHQTTMIICLPGVPAELQAIITQSLPTTFATLFGAGSFQEREVWVNCGDESVLAPILREIATAHPNVYVKSKAKKFGPDLRFLIKLHARGEATEIAYTLAAAANDLATVCRRAGLTIVNS
ncbi:MAG: molybdopterin-binding protein [Acidobacteriota bacterium]